MLHFSFILKTLRTVAAASSRERKFTCFEHVRNTSLKTCVLVQKQSGSHTKLNEIQALLFELQVYKNIHYKWKNNRKQVI